MKNFKSIILILFLISSIETRVCAEDKQKEPQRLKLAKKIPRIPSRRMPSNQYLEFIYFSDPGECMFTFSYDIETLSITIVEVNTNCTYLGEVSQDNPIMYQELPAGDYHITCITDDGDIYEGEDHIQ